MHTTTQRGPPPGHAEMSCLMNSRCTGCIKPGRACGWARDVTRRARCARVAGQRARECSNLPAHTVFAPKMLVMCHMPGAIPDSSSQRGHIMRAAMLAIVATVGRSAMSLPPQLTTRMSSGRKWSRMNSSCCSRLPPLRSWSVDSSTEQLRHAAPIPRSTSALFTWKATSACMTAGSRARSYPLIAREVAIPGSQYLLSSVESPHRKTTGRSMPAAPPARSSACTTSRWCLRWPWYSP
mmetsp:Transcript_1999/g.4261  ORF Transcript_1999/g.4261 Transcript_1999/m.4261 type:complete len:238 (+) Transcript_1999:637-1350(+)